MNRFGDAPVLRLFPGTGREWPHSPLYLGSPIPCVPPTLDFRTLRVPALTQHHESSVPHAGEGSIERTCIFSDFQSILETFRGFQSSSVTYPFTDAFVPGTSFASSIISSNHYHTLIISALQLVELPLNKVPTEYEPVFRREGVFHEIDSLSAPTVASHKRKDKEKDKDKDSEAGSAAESNPPTYMPISASLAASIEGYQKLSCVAIDPDDVITICARVIQVRYLSGDDGKGSDDLFAILSRIFARISEPTFQEKDIRLYSGSSSYRVRSSMVSFDNSLILIALVQRTNCPSPFGVKHLSFYTTRVIFPPISRSRERGWDLDPSRGCSQAS
ncbi:hypothetical protein NLI96_g8448 [Meripilus lineatus]|uniref:Uncharacterized protein n=1 Tax=Meripilus lineatus TaxID=2056292 RepID=A0AAD5YG97_9APHY|nr:hypothetical protein NLI96_g8448 [Physisporinus lineatus]